MNIPAGLLPPAWYWVSDLVLAVLLWDVARNAPWRRLSQSSHLNVWLGTVVVLSVLWTIRTGILPGLGFHLLGATAAQLVFGPRLAIAAMVLVVGSQVATGAITLQALGLNALVMGVYPVWISYAILRLTERRLPPHLFIYIFAAAFFGAAFTMVATGALAAGLLSMAQVYRLEYLWTEYLPWFVLMAWAEAFSTGAALTLMVVYRPTWVSTFDDRRYLGRG
ncbi:MAG TPA: energy-coupling factor ABC transporter permease [Burkholderiales bacterium]|nr:energy-coupling factor ABC transporter permease [Burkholderiales bacterium]